jgi:hypothetical protein
MKMKTPPTKPMGHTKAFLRGKFIAMSAYIKKTERSETNYLMLHLKLLEKKEQAKPKTSRKEIIKNKSKIKEIETQKTKQRLKKTKSCFYEKK